MYLVVHWYGLVLPAAAEQHRPLWTLPERSGGTDGFQLSVFHICHANLSGGRKWVFELVFVRKFLITCTNGSCISAKAP